MSVTYTAEVASSRGFGCFFKLLLRWRGSVYKLIWTDLLLFLVLYYCISATYHNVLNDDQKDTFEKVVKTCRDYKSLSASSLILGFYVTMVMKRWWDQYMSIPWPDSLAIYVSSTIHGHDERGRLMRRTIMRYVCACLTVLLSGISPRVKRRFPTLEHLVDAGLLLDNELEVFRNLNKKFPHASQYWLPIVWASSIVTRARKEGRIRDDFAVKTLIDELVKFRGMCGNLLHYDMISIPLVYTQVVTIFVYSYFLTNIIGSQCIHEKPAMVPGTTTETTMRTETLFVHFPFFLTLEILFYMGWLKVAETLINPFGEDDDDFELNWIIDRNIQLGYIVVDEMHHDHPKLIKDQYWDEVFPSELPYTAATEQFRNDHPVLSTANIQLSAAQQELHLSSVKIDEVGKECDPADDVGSVFNSEGKLSRNNSRVSRKSKAGGTSLARSHSFIDRCKKLLTKEEGLKTGVLSHSNSFASIRPDAGIDTIEELDEQTTKTSVQPKSRPHVRDIFPSSAPVDVPGTSPTHPNDEIWFKNAPTNSPSFYLGGMKRRSRFRLLRPLSVPVGYEEGNLSNQENNRSWASSTNSVLDDDEFERLKIERNRQRVQKLAMKLEHEQSKNPT